MPTDRTRLVDLAHLCLTLEGMAPDDVAAEARAERLEPVKNPLTRLEQHYAQVYSLKAGYFNWEKTRDHLLSAKTALFPLGDPEPMMAFHDVDGWLFLIGPDATVRLQSEKLHSGIYTRYTAHRCEIYGNGWTTYNEALDVLAQVLGEEAVAGRSWSDGVPRDHPTTTIIGQKDPDQASEVSIYFESAQGFGLLGPVNHIVNVDSRHETTREGKNNSLARF